jgi:hypothetical protein
MDGPRLKVERAKEHLDTLKDNLLMWRDMKPYHSILEEDPKTSRYIVRLNVGATPPKRWGTIIGDFAFNLRSALDQAAWQIALLKTDSPGKTQFPIFKDDPNTSKKLLGQWRSQTKYLCATYDFIESCQPYHGGPRAEEHGLWILHEKLCNADKHRVLAPLGHQFRLPLPNGGLIFGVFNDGDVIGYWPIDSDPQKDLQPILMSRVVFDLGSPVGLGLEDLIRIYDYVADLIVPTLASVFP